MPLEYRDLDEHTRQYMLEEIDTDISSDALYLSPWLSERGVEDWTELLRAAAHGGNDASLAAELRLYNRLHRTAQRKKPSGGYTDYKVPVTAADTIAEGEFNRFYVRGLCCRAIEANIATLVIYRAKQVDKPRPGSEDKIGTHVIQTIDA